MGFQCLVLSLYRLASALDSFIYAFLVAFISTMYFFLTGILISLLFKPGFYLSEVTTDFAY
jgi:hypothetical protein